jgi:hypothetical protein
VICSHCKGSGVEPTGVVRFPKGMPRDFPPMEMLIIDGETWVDWGFGPKQRFGDFVAEMQRYYPDYIEVS